MRSASIFMSSRVVRVLSSATISMACVWWPIMPCMNSTSAAVNGGRGAGFAVATRDPAAPGAAGWTVVGGT